MESPLSCGLELQSCATGTVFYIRAELKKKGYFLKSRANEFSMNKIASNVLWLVKIISGNLVSFLLLFHYTIFNMHSPLTTPNAPQMSQVLVITTHTSYSLFSLLWSWHHLNHSEGLRKTSASLNHSHPNTAGILYHYIISSTGTTERT